MGKVIFICNECGKEYYKNSLDEEPIKCYNCNSDNFGIQD